MNEIAVMNEITAMSARAAHRRQSTREHTDPTRRHRRRARRSAPWRR